MGPAHLVHNSSLANNPPMAIIIFSMSHGKELSNLAKIYTDNTKYSGHNHSFTFKLSIVHNICSRANLLPEAKINRFFIIFKRPALDKYPSNIGISNIVINSDLDYYLIINMK